MFAEQLGANRWRDEDAGEKQREKPGLADLQQGGER